MCECEGGAHRCLAWEDHHPRAWSFSFASNFGHEERWPLMWWRACVRAICCTTPDERLPPQSYSILMMNFYHRRRRLHASGEHESRDGSPLDWKVDTAIVRIWIHTFHGRRLLRGSKSSQAVSRTTIKWLRNRLDFFSNAIFTM